MQTDCQALVQRALREPGILASLSPGDLDLSLRLLRRLRLLSHVAAKLEAAGSVDSFPELVTEQLRSALAMAAARARVARWELDRVAWALGANQPRPLIVLKGCAYLLAGLPNARGRIFADVDLMMSRDAIADVERRLVLHGWRGVELTPYDDRYYRVWAHELPPLAHVERDVEVDLHHNLLMTTARLKPDARLLLQAARTLPDSKYQVLAPVDMTLHAMVHLFYGGELADSLRELVDIHSLLEYHALHEPGFWDDFWPRAGELRLIRPAWYGLHYAQKLLGLQIPAIVTALARQHAPPRSVVALMDRLVPNALFAPHPDKPEAGLARLLLFIRSHWIRMPPWLMARHLLYKSLRRH